MHNNVKTLFIGGALVITAGLANAQTTLLDTLGAGTKIGKNSGVGASGGAVVGYDAQATATTGPGNPSTSITQAGYVAVPFTVTGGSYNLTSVSFEGSYVVPADGNAVPLSFYGAIVSTPSTTSGSLNSASTIGGFFQFSGVSSPDDKNRIFTANLSSLTVPVNNNQNYFLVIAPEGKFGSQSGDPVLEYGEVNYYTTSQLPANSSNGITEASLLSEKMGANSGDSLTAPASNVFAAVTLQGTAIAGVPETSTVVTALLGLAPVGGLIIRRRRAN
jgi:hypothetical protein